MLFMQSGVCVEFLSYMVLDGRDWFEQRVTYAVRRLRHRRE